MRHFLDLKDFSTDTLQGILNEAMRMKTHMKQFGQHEQPLAGKTVAMIFEKPSTRTRVSFEVGIIQLGGSPLVLSANDLQLGRGESIEDTARVLSRYVDAIMIRCFSHDMLLGLANHASIPVINALTERSHPCQLMADLMTMIEYHGALADQSVAWVGDGNNMANTWLQAAQLLDFKVNVSTPSGYEVDEGLARVKGKDIRVHYQTFSNPLDACREADLVTTDVWTSMGFEAENEARKQAFSAWCVDEEMMGVAKKNALFMHCLPAHRGEEVSAEVIDGPQSVVWDEAENRMHVQKALMEYLLLGMQH